MTCFWCPITEITSWPRWKRQLACWRAWGSKRSLSYVHPRDRNSNFNVFPDMGSWEIQKTQVIGETFKSLLLHANYTIGEYMKEHVLAIKIVFELRRIHWHMKTKISRGGGKQTKEAPPPPQPLSWKKPCYLGSNSCASITWIYSTLTFMGNSIGEDYQEAKARCVS